MTAPATYFFNWSEYKYYFKISWIIVVLFYILYQFTYHCKYIYSSKYLLQTTLIRILGMCQVLWDICASQLRMIWPLVPMIFHCTCATCVLSIHVTDIVCEVWSTAPDAHSQQHMEYFNYPGPNMKSCLSSYNTVI